MTSLLLRTRLEAEAEEGSVQIRELTLVDTGYLVLALATITVRVSGDVIIMKK